METQIRIRLGLAGLVDWLVDIVYWAEMGWMNSIYQYQSATIISDNNERAVNGGKEDAVDFKKKKNRYFGLNECCRYD